MICAVVADTRAHAKRGAAAVKISYEDLPDPVFTAEVKDVVFLQMQQDIRSCLYCVLFTSPSNFTSQLVFVFVVCVCVRTPSRSRPSLSLGG